MDYFKNVDRHELCCNYAIDNRRANATAAEFIKASRDGKCADADSDHRRSC